MYVILSVISCGRDAELHVAYSSQMEFRSALTVSKVQATVSQR